jgi:hypothetical protein
MKNPYRTIHFPRMLLQKEGKDGVACVAAFLKTD